MFIFYIGFGGLLESDYCRLGLARRLNLSKPKDESAADSCKFDFDVNFEKWL
jgi:hypothetical protein